MDITVRGIHLGKSACSLAGLDASGTVIFRKHLKRVPLLDCLAELPSCTVAMEACEDANHIGRFGDTRYCRWMIVFTRCSHRSHI